MLRVEHSTGGKGEEQRAREHDGEGDTERQRRHEDLPRVQVLGAHGLVLQTERHDALQHEDRCEDQDDRQGGVAVKYVLHEVPVRDERQYHEAGEGSARHDR